MNSQPPADDHPQDFTFFQRLQSFQRFVRHSQHGLEVRAYLSLPSKGAPIMVEGQIPDEILNQLSFWETLRSGATVSVELASGRAGERRTIGAVPVQGHAIVFEKRRVVADSESTQSFDLNTLMLHALEGAFKEVVLGETQRTRTKKCAKPDFFANLEQLKHSQETGVRMLEKFHDSLS